MEPRRKNSETEVRQAVSEEIRALMGRRRVTQTALGIAIGMSQPAISRKLKCEVAWDIDELEAIASYFDVPITDLFGGTLRRYLASVPALEGQFTFLDESGEVIPPAILASVS